jgi:hypothetical protein
MHPNSDMSSTEAQNINIPYEDDEYESETRVRPSSRDILADLSSGSHCMANLFSVHWRPRWLPTKAILVNWTK